MKNNVSRQSRDETLISGLHYWSQLTLSINYNTVWSGVCEWRKKSTSGLLNNLLMYVTASVANVGGPCVRVPFEKSWKIINWKIYKFILKSHVQLTWISQGAGPFCKIPNTSLNRISNLRAKFDKDRQKTVFSGVNVWNVTKTRLFMAAVCNRAGHIYFHAVVSSSSSSSSSSSFFPHLISAVGDWMSTILPHMAWP